MIVFLSDLHTRFDLVNLQVTAAEERCGRQAAAVVILGDVGLFEPFLKRFFRERGQRFLRPTCFIEGNHEDFERFDELVAGYADCLTYLPRGSVHALAGRRFLCVGGAAYMDAHVTQRRSLIGPDDIAACLRHAPADVDAILSHDCPAGVGVPNTPGFEHYGAPGFPGSRDLLARFRPDLWVFGHHHKWFRRDVDQTRFRGLAQSWRGCGVLLPAGEFLFVEHTVQVQLSLGERVRDWLRF